VQLGLDEQYKRMTEVKRAASTGRTAGVTTVAAATAAPAAPSSSFSADRSAQQQQDFLAVAVHYPWARAMSQNKVPYYIKWVV